jgi:hypothetical protein
MYVRDWGKIAKNRDAWKLILKVARESRVSGGGGRERELCNKVVGILVI